MTCEALKLPHRPSPQHLIDVTKEGTEGAFRNLDAGAKA
jgi:hypothetical protein